MYLYRGRRTEPNALGVRKLEVEDLFDPPLKVRANLNVRGGKIIPFFRLRVAKLELQILIASNSKQTPLQKSRESEDAASTP